MFNSTVSCLDKIEYSDEFHPRFIALLFDFAREKDLQLVGVHWPDTQRMGIGFFKLHLDEERGHCDSIGFLLFSISGRLWKEGQLEIQDFDDDLSLNPLAGDDVFILDNSK